MEKHSQEEKFPGFLYIAEVAPGSYFHSQEAPAGLSPRWGVTLLCFASSLSDGCHLMPKETKRVDSAFRQLSQSCSLRPELCHGAPGIEHRPLHLYTSWLFKAFHTCTVKMNCACYINFCGTVDVYSHFLFVGSNDEHQVLWRAEGKANANKGRALYTSPKEQTEKVRQHILKTNSWKNKQDALKMNQII